MAGRQYFLWVALAICLVVSGSILIVLLNDTNSRGDTGRNTTVYMLYASSGSMPQLLNTHQIDGFLTWEPVVSNTQLSGIGKRIAVPADLPPPGRWSDAAINVLVIRQDVINAEPEITGLLSALTTAAIARTNENQTMAEQISADWVYGTKPILTPTGTLSPLAVENLSFHNIQFTADAGPPYSGMVEQILTIDYHLPYNPETMTSPGVLAMGGAYLNGTPPQSPSGSLPTISLGYIPSSDNYAPLYVMVMDSAYFCEQYGYCLVPDNPNSTRPSRCTLYIGTEPAANVNLVQGQSGGGIMTTIGQNALDGAFVGSVPAELQIGLGNPARIIQSINTGGSGLVVPVGYPCNSWQEFVTLAKARSYSGHPMVIAVVQSSIQEDMLREACAYENITVVFYGTDFTAQSA